jgi:hypothetical protein
MTNPSVAKCLLDGWSLTVGSERVVTVFGKRSFIFDLWQFVLTDLVNICCNNTYGNGSNGPRIEAGQH